MEASSVLPDESAGREEMNVKSTVDRNLQIFPFTNMFFKLTHQEGTDIIAGMEASFHILVNIGLK